MGEPISVEAAWREIEEHSQALESQAYPLFEAIGLVLAEAPIGDVALPPFDRSAVDGVAVRAADAVEGRQLRVVDMLLAGGIPRREVQPGEAIGVMTGAPLPPGTETVVMLEHTRGLTSNTPLGHIEITRTVPAGKNISRRGEEVLAGQTLLPTGTQLEPRHVGLLAAQGCLRLLCHRRPQVSVLATGDELVRANQRPGAGQIRNSNSVMLVTQVLSSGALGHDLGIAPDDEPALSDGIRRGLMADVLLLCGGVSAGVKDLVPRVLSNEGVEKVFHQVAMQPGRPVWYGVRGDKHVFGLPGNPVSAFVCFEVLVRPLLRRLMGINPARPPLLPARWEGPALKPTHRTGYVGVYLKRDGEHLIARPVPSRGSSDLMALSRSEALAVIPADTRPFESGDIVPIFPLGRISSFSETPVPGEPRKGIPAT